MRIKYLALFVVILLLPAIAYARTASDAGPGCFHGASAKYYGDVNGDNFIDSTDNALILNHAAGSPLLTGDQFTRADVTGDGDVTAVDALYVQWFYILNNGQYTINSFPACPGITKKPAPCNTNNDNFGDVDGLFGVNSVDKDLIQAHVELRLSPPLSGPPSTPGTQLYKANVYDDGVVDGIDILNILDFINNVRDEFYSCPPVATIQTASSWQRTNFNTQIEYKDGSLANWGDLSACDYRVDKFSGSWITVLGYTSAGSCSGLTTGPVTYSPSISVGPGGCDAQGSNTCRVSTRATDTPGGNTATVSRDFSIDYTAPTVSVIHAPANPTDTQQVTITATASDTGGSGLSRVDIYVDGPLVRTCVSSPCSTTPQTYSVGTHTYFSIAQDGAGNLGRDPASGSYSFTVSSAGQPNLVIDSVTNVGALTVGNTVQFRATMRNAGSVATGADSGGVGFDLDAPGGAAELGVPGTAQLNPGATVTVDSSSWVATAGSHTVHACGDWWNFVSESNEGDNCFDFTFTPAAACTRGTPTVSVTPSSQSGSAGTGLSYTVSVTNTDSVSCGSSTFSFSPISCPVGWTCTTPASLSIAAGTQGSRSVTVTSPVGASPATYSFTYTSTNTASGFSNSGSANYVVNAPCTRSNPTVSVTPASQSAAAGTGLSYTVTVTNQDSASCTPSPSFSISPTSCPIGWTCTTPAALTLASGASSSRSVTVTSPVGATPATYSFTYTSTNSASGQQGSGSANYVVAVCTRGTPTVSVTPVSQSASAGTGLLYTVQVTNTDSVSCGSSTFSFSPTFCPVGWTCTTHASLSIAAGSSGSRTATVTSPVGASPSTYSFTYSSTNTASGFSNSDSADYVIPASCTRANPTVSVTPASQSAAAGTGLSYTVTVTNNDNAACTSSSFSISPTFCPVGWTCTTPANLNIAPGSFGSTSVTVTSPAGASPATYSFTYTSTNTGAPAFFGSGSANYVVATNCGNGVVDIGETCDIAIPSGPGSCPSSCSDGNQCTSDSLINPGTCSAACQFPDSPDGTPCIGGICQVGVCVPNTKYVIINVDYPFVRNRVVSVIPFGGECTNLKGCPNFVRTMPVEFLVRAEIRDTEGRPIRNPAIDPLVTTCNGATCALSSRINSMSWNPLVFSNQAFIGTEQTGSLACDRFLDLEILATSALTSGIETSRIYLNCIQQLTVEPNTIRVALGERNIPSFRVSFWNPEDTQKIIALRMESSHPLVIKGGNLRCVAAGPNCFYQDITNDDSVQMSISPLNSNNVIVDFSDVVTSRAGTYEITFIGTGSEYTATANLIVFAEALDDFQLWQLIFLTIFAIVILVYIHRKDQSY